MKIEELTKKKIQLLEAIEEKDVLLLLTRSSNALQAAKLEIERTERGEGGKKNKKRRKLNKRR